jgi:hypothetical protein
MTTTCDYCGGPHTKRDCGKPSDAECAALVKTLATVLPPALVPPTSTVREWVGASRVAVEKWAASELEARTSGGTVTEPPRVVRDWIRWGASNERDQMLRTQAKLVNVRDAAERYLRGRGATANELARAIAESKKDS